MWLTGLLPVEESRNFNAHQVANAQTKEFNGDRRVELPDFSKTASEIAPNQDGQSAQFTDEAMQTINDNVSKAQKD